MYTSIGLVYYVSYEVGAVCSHIWIEVVNANNVTAISSTMWNIAHASRPTKQNGIV